MADDERVASDDAEADDAATTAMLPRADDAGADGLTKRMPAVDVAQTQEIAPPASLGEVAATAGSFARGLQGRISSHLGRRPALAAAAAAMAMLVILAFVLAGMRAADLPGVDVIAADVYAQASAVPYTPGTFGYDGALTVRSASVVERHRTGGETATATVAASWENEGVVAVGTIELSYRVDGGAWAYAGSATPSVSYVAQRGVDRRALERGAARDMVLGRAETAWRAQAGMADDAAGTSLPTLYADAEMHVISDEFDAEAQTDVIALRFEAAQAFTSLAADVTATFAFRPGTGTWELTGTTVGTGAKDVGYAPLMGSWEASFVETDASGAGKCFGAQGATTRIEIESATESRIAGTMQAIAHFHGEPNANERSDGGDAKVSVGFVGERVRDAVGIAYACTMAESAGGSLSARLEFGLEDDPTGATARITTVHPYQATFLMVPYTRTSTTTDSFVLRRLAT